MITKSEQFTAGEAGKEGIFVSQFGIFLETCLLMGSSVAFSFSSGLFQSPLHLSKHFLFSQHMIISFNPTA